MSTAAAKRRKKNKQQELDDIPALAENEVRAGCIEIIRLDHQIKQMGEDVTAKRKQSATLKVALNKTLENIGQTGVNVKLGEDWYCVENVYGNNKKTWDKEDFLAQAVNLRIASDAEHAARIWSVFKETPAAQKSSIKISKMPTEKQIVTIT